MALFLDPENWQNIAPQCTHNTYSTIDVSGLTRPANAVGVIVTFFGGIDVGHEFNQLAGVRAIGDTTDVFGFDRIYQNVSDYPYMAQQTCKLVGDAFECIASVTDGMQVYVSGWFESEDMSYLNTFTDILPLATTTPVDNTWFTIDVSTLVTGTPSAISVRLYNTTGTSYSIRYRPAPSTRELSMAVTLATTDIILPLTNNQVEIYASDVSRLGLLMNAYTGPRFIRSNTEDDVSLPLTYTSPTANTWYTYSAATSSDLPIGAPVVAYNSAGGARSFVKPADNVVDYNTSIIYGFKTFFTKCDNNGQFSIKNRYNNSPVEIWGAWYPSQSTPVGITNVNTNNKIVSNGNIQINGTALDTATVVKLINPYGSDVDLTVAGSSFSNIECAPIDVFSTQFKYNTDVELQVVGPDNTASINIQFIPSTGIDVMEVVTNGGYLSDGLAVQVGDQMCYPNPVAGSVVIGYDNTDLWYDPSLPDGTTHSRWWYAEATNTWDVGDVVVNRPAVAEPPVWTATFTLPVGHIGVDYYFDTSVFCSSSTSQTFTVAGDTLGLVYGTDGVLSGKPTQTGNPELVFTSTNADGSADTPPITLLVDSAQIYDAQHQDVRDVSFQITCSTTTADGRIYYVVDPNPNQPTDEQIYYGKSANGNTALVQASWPVTIAGVQPWQLIQGLEPETDYYYWFVQATFPEE